MRNPSYFLESGVWAAKSWYACFPSQGAESISNISLESWSSTDPGPLWRERSWCCSTRGFDRPDKQPLCRLSSSTLRQASTPISHRVPRPCSEYVFCTSPCSCCPRICESLMSYLSAHSTPHSHPWRFRIDCCRLLILPLSDQLLRSLNVSMWPPQADRRKATRRAYMNVMIGNKLIGISTRKWCAILHSTQITQWREDENFRWRGIPE